MRNLVLVLLLANAALFMWNLWFSEDGEVGTPIEPVGDVLLVDEVGTVEAAAVVSKSSQNGGGVEPQTPGNARTAARCVSLGPFAELGAAATAGAGLKSSGLSAAQRVSDGQIWVGYWVHIDGLPSRRESNRVLDQLKKAGISEAYIVGEDESGFTISLGVFSEIARAGRRRQQARDLELNAIVTNRTRQGSVYWLDFELAPGESLDMNRFSSAKNPIVELRERNCS